MDELIAWIHASEAPPARHAEVAVLAATTIGNDTGDHRSAVLEEVG